MIGLSENGVDIESCGEASRFVDVDGEGFQDSCSVVHACGPAGLRAQFEEGRPQFATELAPERKLVVLADFELDDSPVVFESRLSELAQKDGLPNPSQTGDDHRLLAPSPLKSAEQELEGTQLVIASDDRGRLCSGVGRVGVRQGVHDVILLSLSRVI